MTLSIVDSALRAFGTAWRPWAGIQDRRPPSWFQLLPPLWFGFRDTGSLHRHKPSLQLNPETSAATGQLVADLLLLGGQLDQLGTERSLTTHGDEQRIAVPDLSLHLRKLAESSPMVARLRMSSMAPPATARTEAPTA